MSALAFRVLRSIWHFTTWVLLNSVALVAFALVGDPSDRLLTWAGLTLSGLLVFACGLVLTEPVWADLFGGWAAYHGLTRTPGIAISGARARALAVSQWVFAALTAAIAAASATVFVQHRTDWLHHPGSDPVTEVLVALYGSLGIAIGALREGGTNAGGAIYGIFVVGLASTVVVGLISVAAHTIRRPTKRSKRKKKRSKSQRKWDD